MANPIRRLKEIFGELLLNSRETRLDAARLLDRIAGIEQNLRRVDADLERLLALTPFAHGGENPSRMDPSRIYFGLNDLDRALEAHLDFNNGFFVELGANDGIAQSNTLHFERFRGWSGILVEPTPHNFMRCRANRSERTRVFCCACTSFDYPDRFVEIAFSNLMSTPIGLDSDIPDPMAHAEEGRPFLAPSEDVFTFGARARPLNELLIEAAAPPVIDLLSLDVEGAEMEVLKGIDHTRFRFRYVCIECRDTDRMVAYLAGQGYEMLERLSHHDYLFRDSRPGHLNV